tara:strand:- start:270 stop:449 length:180 start_codon:yes stop_codon:yes gene_type:complete
MGRRAGFSAGKKMKRLHASREQSQEDHDETGGLDNGTIEDDDCEPQLAQPSVDLLSKRY